MARPDREPDDAALVAAFRAGDEDAVAVVYRRYAGPMQATARWMLRDHALAADAVQQAFLQAWRSADRFDADRPLAPWLFQITRRVCIDTIRATAVARSRPAWATTPPSQRRTTPVRPNERGPGGRCGEPSTPCRRASGSWPASPTSRV